MTASVFMKMRIIIAILILLVPCASHAETQKISFSQEFYSEIGSWTIQDAYDFFTTTLKTEPTEIYEGWISYENNPIMNDIQFERIVFSTSSVIEDEHYSSSLYAIILRPFGEEISQSQFYIDLVNHFQQIYGRGETSNYLDGPFIYWKIPENSQMISVHYETGDVGKGRSPTITIMISIYPDKNADE